MRKHVLLKCLLLVCGLLSATVGFSQTTLFYDNCNTMANWTNTGARYMGNTVINTGTNWQAVVPIVPAADHTGGGGGVLYTNGNANYEEAAPGGQSYYILYRIQSAPINLTGWDNTRLEFWMQLRDETGNWDGGFLEWSHNGTTWTQVTNAQLCSTGNMLYDGNMSQNAASTPFYFMTRPAWFNLKTTWTRMYVDISAMDNVPAFYLRYTFHSDQLLNAQGWCIDDIRVVSIARPEVRGNNIVIPDNDITPIPADNTDFGNVGVGFTSVKTYFIHNTGESPLTLTGTPYVTVTGTGFSVLNQPSTNVIPPGGSVSFDVQFAPGVIGLVNGTVNIPNSDTYSSCAPPNPYNYAIRANALIINVPPYIIDPPNDTIVCPNTSPLNIPFTINDSQQSPNVLTLSATSSNPTVITNANIVFGGTGANRNVTLTPVFGATGSSVITITVDDGQPLNNDSSFTFTLTLADSINPTPVCQNVDVLLDANGNGTLVAGLVDNGSTDNCAIFSMNISQTQFTCADVGQQALVFTVNDIVGNSSTCNFTANVIPAPLVASFTTSDYNGYNISCFGGNDGSITVSSSAGCPTHTYAWSHDPSNTTSQATGLSAGNYQVTVTDGANQQQILNVVLTEPAQLTDQSTSMDISCFGEIDGSVNLAVTGGVQPYTYSQGPQLNNMPAGTYNYTITDNNNCQVPVTLTIAEPPGMSISGLTEYSIYCGEEQPLAIDVTGGSGGFTYNWDNDFAMDCSTCEDPIASPNKSTVFTVIVTDSRLCNETYSITVEVDCNVFIPNAFTPNMDELNQYFKVIVTNPKEFVMSIYNQWGQEIYTTMDAAKGWDGTYQGIPVQAGVYVYDVGILMPDGKEVNRRGMVTVLR